MNRMWRALAVSGAVGAGAWVAAPAHAGNGLDVLPRGAVVQATAALPGFKNAVAVSYRKGQATVEAVISPVNGKRAVRWSRSLGSGHWTVTAPGPRGVFWGVRVASISGSQTAFAYVFNGASTTSAIQGHRSGEVTGDRGVVLKSGRLTVRKRDSAHAGDVQYRFETSYVWNGMAYVPGTTRHVPDYTAAAEPRPSVSLEASNGSVALIRVQVASTAAARATGLMNVTAMDADSGMIFIWPSPVLDPFWMKDTYIPLSIAFIDSDLKVVDIQRMAPLDETLHVAASPFQYAIEANAGFFDRNGIQIGDTVQLHLQ